MSEQLGFALVLIVAIASVASVLFLSGATPTASVVAGACADVRCPGHAEAYPLLNQDGFVLFSDEGKPVCVCPE